MENPQTTEKLDFEKVWLMFQETDKKFKETDEQFKKSERAFTKRMNQLEELFTGQWGKLVESLVDGKIVQLLREKGVDVHQTTTRLVDPDRLMEVDILAINETEAVVVEVKTTLKIDKVDDFVVKLQRFKSVFKKFSDMKIYGAMAFLRDDTGSARYAEKQGLFVIKATGDSAKIINRKAFIPVEW